MFETKPNIFLLAGRTGGPLSPLISISKNLPDFQAIYLGVKNSYEEKLANDQCLNIEYLPEAKLTLLTFKNTSFFEKVLMVGEFFWHLVLLSFSVLKCFYLILKFKPKAVLSAGSFLAVPVVFAAKITNFLRLSKTKIIVHQQDPEPGISNKFAVKFADLKTCIFPYTKEKYPDFKNADLIPNPIDFEKFTSNNNKKLSLLKELNKPLFDFYSKISAKPILLIFGGGSGAKFINDWTEENLNLLLKKFRVVHLTGAIQNEKLGIKNEKLASPDYFQTQSLFTEMPASLSLADLVLCRSGLASITELEFLQKPAFLVPIESSHQELNAELVKDKFYILHQKTKENWLNEITENYPNWFKKVKYNSQEETITRLQDYYGEINKVINKI